MKGKGTWKRWLCAALAMVLLCTLPGTAFGAEKPEWRYGDSIFVEVQVDEMRTFSPEDFPVIDCKKVFVLKKVKRADGVIQYQLVLIPNSSKKTNIKEDIEKLLTLPMVTYAAKNHEFVTPEKFYLKLNHTCLYLAVGETADVTMKDCYLYDEDRIYGIEFRPNPEYFDMDALQKDSFSEYGITRFWPDIQGEHWTIVMPEKRPEELEGQKSENGYYYGTAGNANEHLFEVLNRIASMPEFSFVRIVKAVRVGWELYSANNRMGNTGILKSSFDSEKRFDESWSMENTDIADYTLSRGNGHLNEPGNNPIGRIATVRGQKPGITKITCEESEYDSHIASDCAIIVYEPGSKDNPGDLNHDGVLGTYDALQVLEYSVGLISLDEKDKAAADLNQDYVVGAEDALLMLKIAAGCL